MDIKDVRELMLKAYNAGYGEGNKITLAGLYRDINPEEEYLLGYKVDEILEERHCE
tara:strand:- start:776 stop:943 length:168 start_codon:yes stop_codon:yes gene_type:complete